MDGVEVYALAAERSRAALERFLAAFGPVSAPVVDTFAFPQFDAAPSRRFDALGPLLDFLEARPDAAYSLYWPAAHLPTWPRPLMAFFTEDGSLVLGAVVAPSEVGATLAALAREVGARFGRVGTMLPPETRADAFVEGCRSADGPRLVDGRPLGTGEPGGP